MTYPPRPTKIYINSEQDFCTVSTWSSSGNSCWDAEYIDATDEVALREALAEASGSFVKPLPKHQGEIS